MRWARLSSPALKAAPLGQTVRESRAPRPAARDSREFELMVF
jgi:hypothetical protein